MDHGSSGARRKEIGRLNEQKDLMRISPGVWIVRIWRGWKWRHWRETRERKEEGEEFRETKKSAKLVEAGARKHCKHTNPKDPQCLQMASPLSFRGGERGSTVLTEISLALPAAAVFLHAVQHLFQRGEITLKNGDGHCLHYTGAFCSSTRQFVNNSFLAKMKLYFFPWQKYSHQMPFPIFHSREWEKQNFRSVHMNI